jgi:hypothetical protein
MSVTAAGYAKARSEITALFGWDASAMSPEQVLRVDCATALRLGLDMMQGRLIRGETVDMVKMLTASEALAKLLPSTVLSAPPAEHREDPRKALLEIILRMKERGEIGDRADEPSLREQVATLEAENARLRAAARAAAAPAVEAAPAAPAANVVPLARGAPASAAPAPAAKAYDYDANSEWKSYVNSDGSIRATPRGRWDI